VRITCSLSCVCACDMYGPSGSEKRVLLSICFRTCVTRPSIYQSQGNIQRQGVLLPFSPEIHSLNLVPSHVDGLISPAATGCDIWYQRLSFLGYAFAIHLAYSVDWARQQAQVELIASRSSAEPGRECDPLNSCTTLI